MGLTHGPTSSMVLNFSGLIQDVVDYIREKGGYDDLSYYEWDEYIRDRTFEFIECSERYISPGQSSLFIEIVKKHLKGGYGVIEPLLAESGINEIMINGPSEIFVEKGGMIVPVDDAFLSVYELEALIRKIAADVHREFNEANPIVDARTSEGYRVNGIHHSVAVNGPVLTIRRFGSGRMTYRMLENKGTLTKEMGEDLLRLISAGYNIFISGGTSSGKTTLLNAMCSEGISLHERLLVIEDSGELQIEGIPNTVYLECRNANSIGKGEINMSSLIRTSLRMRPDRIIVGEVRGAEVVDMIQAMNTGHDGSISTGHGNSITGMLARLESMYMMGSEVPLKAIQNQIVNAIDIMVHMKRMPDGMRKVTEVAELTGISEEGYDLNYLYASDAEGNTYRTDNIMINQERYNRLYAGDSLVHKRTMKRCLEPDDLFWGTDEGGDIDDLFI